VRVLQRVVFPLDDDPEIAPLYYEGELVLREGLSAFAQPCPPDCVLGRRSIKVDPDTTISTGTYFNMFPAAYWAESTEVRKARLVVIVEGTGAIEVFCTDEHGKDYLVTRREFIKAKSRKISVDVSLTNFARGGSYWFDLVGPTHSSSTSVSSSSIEDLGDARLLEGWWECDSDTPQGTLSIGVTTYNRPADVVLLLQQVESEPELLAILDDVYVVDQGTQHCIDEPDFETVQKALGARLHIIDQQNLGGSGGISRGMLETTLAGKSTYHLISDDDVKIEPESILRAVAFADHCTKPTLVGGHMFSLTHRSHLHSWGERVNMDDFWWTAVLDQPYGANFDSLPLRVDPLLHQRIDVDYNGWWMELIPVPVIEKLGLSLPLFIKWDDAEFGLRAKEAGIPTVTLPGVACWHMPWEEKIDGIDWQAYYHARNRLVSALLHSTKKQGGRVLDATFEGTIKNLYCQQYSTARFRNDAVEALLSGPQHMQPELGTKRGEIQKIRQQYPDAILYADASELPEIISGSRIRLPLTRRRWKTGIGQSFGRFMKYINELMPVNPSAKKNPQASFMVRKATPGKMLNCDSALITMPDGTTASMYIRDPHIFAHEYRRTRRLDRQLRRNWNQLARQYRSQAKADTSLDSWEATFGILSPETEIDIEANPSD